MTLKVYVAGHTGMVGSAVVRALHASQCETWHPEERIDLRDPHATSALLDRARQDGVNAIVLAAATVGGIGANTNCPTFFLENNLLIACNVIRGAYTSGIPRLVNLGSSCIYPRLAAQPIREEALLTGPLEPTNEAYAVAKIAALKLVQAYRRQYRCRYISLMPTNLYGPGDRYDADFSHVIPSLILKFERARLQGDAVTLWGTGQPLREFLHVDDLASAVVIALSGYDDDLWLNVGSDDELSIADLAGMIGKLCDYKGSVRWDHTRPDGMPRKRLDCSRMRALGWQPKVSLSDGLRQAIGDFRSRGIAVTFNDHLDI